MTMQVYPDGWTRRDGARGRILPRGLAACRFRVAADGSVSDLRTGIAHDAPRRGARAVLVPATTPASRSPADDALRARSTRASGAALDDAFDLGTAQRSSPRMAASLPRAAMAAAQRRAIALLSTDPGRLVAFAWLGPSPSSRRS